MNRKYNTLFGLASFFAVSSLAVFAASVSPEAVKCFTVVLVCVLLSSIDFLRNDYTRADLIER